MERRREKNRKTIDSFGLGQDLSEGGGSQGYGPKAAGWDALDELPSLLLSPRSSSAPRLSLRAPLRQLRLYQRDWEQPARYH